MSSKQICATKYQKDSGNEGKSSMSKQGMKDCCWVKKKKRLCELQLDLYCQSGGQRTTPL